MAEMTLVQCKAAEPVQSRNTPVQLRRRKQSDDLSDLSEHCSRNQVRVKHMCVCVKQWPAKLKVCMCN